MKKEDKYNKLLIEGGLFFHGPSKGSFILPANGYALWKNIQNILDKKFAARGVQNVLLPALIPFNLLEREKKHIEGFSPECFYIEKTGEKKLEIPLILRPTSEVLFYEWYQKTLHTYRQLPFLYNQWCSVFRGEKNTTPFFRNTEFLWQEGHTIHSSSEEAKQFALNILSDYQNYVEKNLCLGAIVGKKTEGEKFAGALETYTVECLLPDGQCLQVATSHYFGDNFCRLIEVKFQNKNNQIEHPFSTSWGTSTRAIGAVAKSHFDEWGLILPFDVAPVQIAFILVNEKEELVKYYQEIIDLLKPVYRCQLYNKSNQINLNVIQADKEGCPFKVILGINELKNEEITLIRRDNIERKITINLKENEIEKNYLSAFEKYVKELGQIDDNLGIKKEIFRENIVNSHKKGARSGRLFSVIEKERKEFMEYLYQKNADYLNNHIYLVNNLKELEKKINNQEKGLFLIPFCNELSCEKKIKEKMTSYSIRCINLEKKTIESDLCIFCQSKAKNIVYLGRSY
ncbi:MAG: Proline--tRNA ligase [Mycoplasmataceae bacterium]|nr:MAG: Proline--tRNA ligase [Mycoplasmataceae bacterium]